MSTFVPDPQLLAHEDAAKFVGLCPRLLTECCRKGVIPWPTDPWGRFSKADLEVLRKRFGKSTASR